MTVQFQLARLIDLNNAVEESVTIERKELSKYHDILQSVATLTNQLTADLRIPDSELNISYAEQFGPDLKTVIERIPQTITMDGKAFRRYLARAIDRVRDIARSHP